MTPIAFFLLVSPLLMAPYVLKEQFEAPKALLLLLTGYALAFAVSPDPDRLTLAAALWPVVFLGACLAARQKVVGIVGLARSFDGLLHQIAYLLLFLAAREVTLDEIRWPVLAAAAGATAYGLVQVWGKDPIPWNRGVSTLETYARPNSTLGHPNHLGAYLAMAAPLVASWESEIRWALLLPLVVVVAATVSRAAWAALAAGLGTYAALSGFGWEVLLVGGFGLAGLNVILDTPLRRATRERIVSLFRLGSDERAHFYPVIWRLIRKHLLVGVGPENLAQEIVREARPGELPPGVVYLRAHCEPLHVLATTGVFGSLVAGAFVATLGWRAIDRFAVAPADAAPLIAALVAYAVAMLPSFHAVATLGLAAVCAGVLAGS